MPIGHGKLDEFPEDVVVALLQNDSDIPYQQRRLIYAGVRDAFSEVDNLVRKASVLNTQSDTSNNVCYTGINTFLFSTQFTRVCRVAELTGNNVCYTGINTFLLCATTYVDPPFTPRQMQQVVSAAMRYSFIDRKIWFILLKQEEVASLVFRKLIDIDEANIHDYFNFLLKKQFIDDWKIDVWFLAEYLRKANKIPVIWTGICKFVGEYGKDMWTKIKNNEENNPCWPEDVIDGLVAMSDVFEETKRIPSCVEKQKELPTEGNTEQVINDSDYICYLKGEIGAFKDIISHINHGIPYISRPSIKDVIVECEKRINACLIKIDSLQKNKRTIDQMTNPKSEYADST